MSTTINISMPEPLRFFIETQAAAQNYSTSEYVRHLVRKEQQAVEAEMDRFLEHNRDDILALIAIAEEQLAHGEFSTATAEDIITQGRARRAKAKKRTQ
jgi:Arc/MetJ-type ribon-helix-helix transcriptional regulator